VAMKAYLTLILILIILLPFENGYSFDFTIVCYDSNTWGTQISIKSFDLDSKRLLNNLTIPFPGEIVTNTPLKLRIGRRDFYVVITNDGSYSKNCASHELVTRYAILNDSLNLVRIDSIVNISFIEFDGTTGDSLEFSYFETVSDTGLTTSKGLFSISPEMRINRRRVLPINYRLLQTPEIVGYSYPRKLNIEFPDYFWDTSTDFNVDIVRFDIVHRRRMSTIQLGNFMSYAQVFGAIPASRSLYAFSLSYDIPRGGGNVTNRNSAPSFVKKYTLPNLAFTDSIPIANNAADSDYIRNEVGQCEQVGPFFVYYFFASDDVRYFSPAMLFIFDTRTNQATWLRVGWR
jgi:hypothetical protein